MDRHRVSEDTINQGAYVFVEMTIDGNHYLDSMSMWGRGQLEFLTVFSISPLPQARPEAIEARDARPRRVLERAFV